jgi:hypothetical protein
MAGASGKWIASKKLAKPVGIVSVPSTVSRLSPVWCTYISLAWRAAHTRQPSFSLCQNSKRLKKQTSRSIRTAAPPSFLPWETLSTTLNKIPKLVDYLVCQLELSDVPFSYTSLNPSYGIIFDTTPRLQHGELFRKSFPDLLRHPRGHHSTGWSTLPRLGRLYFVPSDASIS